MQQLLNPFAQNYPEGVDCTLPSTAQRCKFNPSGPYAGHYIATGGGEGLVEIWDLDTKGVIRTFEGHVRAVSGLSWSRNNRYLLTSSLDHNCIIWDLSYLSFPTISSSEASSSSCTLTSPRKSTVRFDAPVIDAVFHPRNSKIILATLSTQEAVLVDLRQGSSGRWVLDATAEAPASGDGADGQDVDMEAEARPAAKRLSVTTALFSACGTRIYAGTSAGVLLVFDSRTRLVLHRIKVANAGIRQANFDLTGQNLILSSSDRALRTLYVSPLTGLLTPLHRFQDLINRTPWHAIGFSGDAEYVMGGAGHKMAHNIFVWDRDAGGLVKVLEGPKEPLMDCDWHPTRPIIASVTSSGDLHIWQTTSPDNWSAFAPGFEELDENVEYKEREDEFDIEDETILTRRKQAEEDLMIDVLTQVHDSYPVRPLPYTTLPPGYSETDDEGLETEEAICVNAMKAAEEWAMAEGDDDDWEGFYLSLDLVEELEQERLEG